SGITTTSRSSNGSPHTAGEQRSCSPGSHRRHSSSNVRGWRGPCNERRVMELSRGRPGNAVTFYLPDQRALRGVYPEGLDCDRDWAVFGTGVFVWVLQTFLRL